MRNLVWIGAVAVVVMASGTIAGQKRNPPAPVKPPAADRMTLFRQQASRLAALTPSAVVDRILSFDANKDHRIASDELPERMEGLVSRGDKNHDGFLTSEEVVALVDTRPAVPRPRVAPSPQTLADVIADLKLPLKTHNLAMAIVKAPLNVNAPSSANLDAAMRELLNDEDYENFVAAADRIERTPRVVVGGQVGGVIID